MGFRLCKIKIINILKQNILKFPILQSLLFFLKYFWKCNNMIYTERYLKPFTLIRSQVNLENT